ncbi:DUF192 domain-containing protein [Marinicella gelatinilytica]|uniref:DUF192 domain-containing protein n=1 Tax=Marinicella gelatinilytica TaxID=2996017 RepID=UPI00226103B3|nr:DUF192 domain-containing protein [Marinicella gelatinilytica]MCX7545647.1 DUF192 domain-containing protein [Marinicella gelatinilytica]
MTLILLLSACQSLPDRVSINGVAFQVTVADDDNSRAMGLMYRESMPEDVGMLFIFPDSQPRAFWMKNTLIPLDILYFNQHKKLVSIQADVPPCRSTTTRCPNYPSKYAAQYVLEINAGLANRYDFKLGDELLINLKK